MSEKGTMTKESRFTHSVDGEKGDYGLGYGDGAKRDFSAIYHFVLRNSCMKCYMIFCHKRH